MKAKLISPESSPPDWEIELKRLPVVIGRSSEAEIQPLDGTVSERHCELEEMDGCLIVHDLGSECGTFVNGVQIDVARLMPGDVLTVGKSNFIASYDLSEQQMPQASDLPADVEMRRLDHDSVELVTLAELGLLLERQRRVYRSIYNRSSSQAEPMFPDPPHPEHLEHLLVQEMKLAGVEPQFVYAFEKTGTLVTEFNYDSISADEMVEWQAAVDEYEERYGCDDRQYPMGIVTMYGPDKSTTTVIVAAVLIEEDSNPIHRRWEGDGVATDAEVKQQITDFFRSHDVHSVVYVSENVGCPHQEGLDYPMGQECPYCPDWEGQNKGST